MKKRNVIFILILSVSLIFSGCSKKKEEKKEIVGETKKIEEKAIEKEKEDIEKEKEIKEENKEEEKIEEPKVEKKVEKPIKKEVKKTETPKTKEVKKETVQVDVNKEENTPTEIVEEIKEEVIKPSEEDIISKYTLQMEGLRSEFEVKLKGLMGQAKTEYMSYPEEQRGRKKISLGLKYLRKASELEGECDNKVEVVLSDLKNELKENEYDTKIVQKMKVAYDTQKSEKRSALMKKALKKE